MIFYLDAHGSPGSFVVDRLFRKSKAHERAGDGTVVTERPKVGIAGARARFKIPTTG